MQLHSRLEPAEWSLAEKHEAAIREVLTGDGPTKEWVKAAAVALACPRNGAHCEAIFAR
jgi:hypothetical protein